MRAKGNASLVELDSDKNSIGDEGASTLAAALHANTRLTSISSLNNNIGDEGTKMSEG